MVFLGKAVGTVSWLYVRGALIDSIKYFDVSFRQSSKPQSMHSLVFLLAISKIQYSI